MKKQPWHNRSEAIAKRIAEELDAQKIRKIDFAKKLKVHKSYITLLLKGKQNLNLWSICKIEAALGITLIEVDKARLSIQE